MYKILALAASVEAYTLDLHYHITDGTVTGAAEILDNCPNGDAMAPLGNTFYDYYFNTGGWVDEEPCSCLSWAAGETSEVTYSFDQEYFVWDVLLTASNRASYASLDGAEIHVTRGDMYSTLCATTSATL